jgi:hypothetical protein
LAEAGITKGCNPPGNDRLCPDDPVTRGQMAAVLTRALGFPDRRGRSPTPEDRCSSVTSGPSPPG